MLLAGAVAEVQSQPSALSVSPEEAKEEGLQPPVRRSSSKSMGSRERRRLESVRRGLCQIDPESLCVEGSRHHRGITALVGVGEADLPTKFACVFSAVVVQLVTAVVQPQVVVV